MFRDLHRSLNIVIKPKTTHLGKIPIFPIFAQINCPFPIRFLSHTEDLYTDFFPNHSNETQTHPDLWAIGDPIFQREVGPRWPRGSGCPKLIKNIIFTPPQKYNYPFTNFVMGYCDHFCLSVCVCLSVCHFVRKHD